MPKRSFDFTFQHPIQEANWDFHRTNPLTLVAADTASSEVVCPTKMEGPFLIQPDPHTNPQRVVPLVKAGWAVTHWADLPTGIAADTAIELTKPELYSFIRCEISQTIKIGVIIDSLHLLRFSDQHVINNRLSL